MSLDLYYIAVNEYGKNPNVPFTSVVNTVYEKHFIDLTSENYFKREADPESYPNPKRLREDCSEPIFSKDVSSDSCLNLTDCVPHEAEQSYPEIEDEVVGNLKSMFPEAELKYIQFLKIISEKSIRSSAQIHEHILDILLQDDYPKINQKIDRQPVQVVDVDPYDWKKQILPNYSNQVQIVDNKLPDLENLEPLENKEPHEFNLFPKSGLLPGIWSSVPIEIEEPVIKIEPTKPLPLLVNITSGDQNYQLDFNVNVPYPPKRPVLPEPIDLSDVSFEAFFTDYSILDNSKDRKKELTESKDQESNISNSDPVGNNSITANQDSLENPDGEKSIFKNIDFPAPVITNSPKSEEFTAKEELTELDLNPKMEDSVVVLSQDEIGLYMKILPIFPDGCPNFLRKQCVGKENTEIEAEQLIMELISTDIPKRVEEISETVPLDLEEQINLMITILPDADPSYIRSFCTDNINEPEKLSTFISECLEGKDYPTRIEYERKQKLTAQITDYTTNFNVNKFLELIPEPKQYFNDPNRVVPYDLTRIDYALKSYFKNLFPEFRISDIDEALTKSLRHHAQSKNLKPTIIDIYNFVKNRITYTMRTRRRPVPVETITNIPMLQEIAYLTHEKEIEDTLKLRQREKEKRFQEAKSRNMLLSCECCYDDEVMVTDTTVCQNNHIFCNSCVTKSIEVTWGEGKTTFKCMAQCDQEFSLHSLQKVLQPKLFSRIALRKQLDEVKEAGIADLETCPFCDFATIPEPGNKIFKCLNNECMKESCRECKEPSHIPYRCEEVEKPDELKARKLIEDKMTEALLRTCWKCALKFIKHDGCNKMTCPRCGSFMCYVCQQPVKDYSHFNGQGGSRLDLCPLYSDTEKLHLEQVRENAIKAKQEVADKIPNVKLKYDPLTGLPEPPKEDRVYKPVPLVPLIAEQPFPFPPLQDQVRQIFAARRHVHHHHHRRRTAAATYIPRRN